MNIKKVETNRKRCWTFSFGVLGFFFPFFFGEGGQGGFKYKTFRCFSGCFSQP